MYKINFTRRKINVQVSRTEKLTCNKFHEQKSTRNKFHKQNKLHEGKISMYKLHEEKNQYAKGFTSKLQVLRRKISTQRVAWTKSVAPGEKSIYKFHEEKNKHSISFTNKISTQHVPRTKNHCETSSMRRKEINVLVSRREKINMQQVSWI